MAFRTLQPSALATALREERELACGAQRVLERVFWGARVQGGGRVVSLVPRSPVSKSQVPRLKEEA